ncbi:MAG: hypothetical protein CFE40_02590 [Burkholderiales bacterium PBB1]|nr:MAG: hypothetical protein CFE40_02590 [Burkholderiales bacterium PBB1]
MAMRSRIFVTVVVSILLVEIGLGVFEFGPDADRSAAKRLVAAAPAPPVATPPAVAVPPAEASSPAARQEAAVPVPKGPSIAADGVAVALTELVGTKAAEAWLRLDDFPHRLVATVDNLSREQAAASLWPVGPTAGHFSVVQHEGRLVIDPDNQLRYAPFVQWVEGLDSAKVVAVYVRLLPLLQRTYEELGYPLGLHFQAQLLKVIDSLLAAPEAAELIEVKLTDVKGPVPSLRPWVRYEFADAELESASAGQKLMVRIGAPNETRLKAKLRALRSEIVRQSSDQ